MLEANKAIWIDNDGYWNLDADLYGNTVTVALGDTTALDRIVDTMRVALGHLPMFPDDRSVEYDSDGWYDFYIRLDSTSKTKIGSTIEAIVISSDADDNEQSYDIHLTEAEQTEVYNELDRQFRERFGTSCDELLAEAKKYAVEEAV